MKFSCVNALVMKFSWFHVFVTKLSCVKILVMKFSWFHVLVMKFSWFQVFVMKFSWFHVFVMKFSWFQEFVTNETIWIVSSFVMCSTASVQLVAHVTPSSPSPIGT